MLKLTKESSAKHLRKISNLSFTIGIFPGSLKIAKVTSFTKRLQTRML